MVPSTKINLPENLNLYCQVPVYYQVVPPAKINSLENLKIVYEDFQNYGMYSGLQVCI